MALKTEAEANLKEIESEVASLSEEDRTNVNLVASTLRELIRSHGTNAILAIAWVGAKLAVESED